jgi:hypothetical protein
VPLNARASPHDSNSWASGGASGRGPRSRPRTARDGPHAGPCAPPARSPGRRAPCTPGLPPRMSSNSAAPESISSTSSRSEAIWSLDWRDHRLRIDHGLADVAQDVVDRVDEGMNGRGLLVADDDQARARGALFRSPPRRRSIGMGGHRIDGAWPAPGMPSSRASASVKAPMAPGRGGAEVAVAPTSRACSYRRATADLGSPSAGRHRAFTLALARSWHPGRGQAPSMRWPPIPMDRRRGGRPGEAPRHEPGRRRRRAPRPSMPWSTRSTTSWATSARPWSIRSR